MKHTELPDVCEFDFGALVAMRAATEEEEERGVVTGILFRPGSILYLVTWSDRNECQHYGCELKPA